MSVWSSLGGLVTGFHNICQIIGWFYLLQYLLVSLTKNPEFIIYEPREKHTHFIYVYQFIQQLQALEILYPVFGWQRASLGALIPQTLGRMIFGMISLPLYVNSPASPWIFITLLMFSIVESFRYSFYFLKQIGLDTSFIGLLFGWFRYNLFLVCYPIGAVGECMVLLNSRKVVGQNKYYSIEMPNKFNFAFDMEMFMGCLPVIYLLAFPQLYMYLVAQRKRYFQGLKQDSQKKKQ